MNRQTEKSVKRMHQMLKLQKLNQANQSVRKQVARHREELKKRKAA